MAGRVFDGAGTLSDPAGDGAVLGAGEGLDRVAVGGGGDPGLVDAAAHEVLADGDDALFGELLVSACRRSRPA